MRWPFSKPLLLFVSLTFATPSFAGELAESDQMMNKVWGLAWGEKFAELEAMAETFRSEATRTVSGRWRLSDFYNGLGKFLNSCAMSCEGILARWQAQYPDSPTMWLVRADHFLVLAWDHRGDGNAGTVADDAWKPFHENVAKARQLLEEHKDVALRDPVWYSNMMTVAIAEGWPAADFARLTDEGLDRHPLYYSIYLNAVEYLAPKWHGDAAAIEKFAREAVARTQASEGFTLYARIYWYAAETQFDQALFEQSDVVWADMKAGIDDVLKAYPDQWNINNFARFACLAGDYDKARELAARIEGEPDPVVWDATWYDDRCGV